MKNLFVLRGACAATDRAGCHWGRSKCVKSDALAPWLMEHPERRRTTQLAWFLFALGIIPALIAIVLFAFVEVSNAAFSAATLLLYPAVGALIAYRRPENLLGWLLLATGIANSLSGLGQAYVQYASSVGSLPAEMWLEWVSNVLTFPTFLTMFTFILLLFPAGRLLSRRWRPLAWLAAALIVAIVLYQALAVTGSTADNGAHYRNPMYVAAIGDMLRPLRLIGFLGELFVLVGSLIALGLRLRRSRGIERQQLKWFVYVATVSVVAFIFSGLCATIDPTNQGGIIGGVFWFTAVFGIEMGLPAVVGLAIVRYRLYEIDRVINRTLVYSILTAILVGTDLLLVVVIERLFQPVASGSDLVVAGSTLAVAACVQPLRRRIQTTVDRRFYRHKYDAVRTVEAFSARLRDEIDLDALLAELGGVVKETMQPAHLSLWLREG
jgi:hypothetical protein